MSSEDLSATRSVKTVGRLITLHTREDIPQKWRGSPFEELIGAHNFDKQIESSVEPRLLVVSCIEFRFRPIIPTGFAYVMRTAGGRLSNLTGAEFALSYVLSKGVKHIALVGHNDCGMTKVFQAKPKLVEALIEQGWDRSKAFEFIEQNAPRFAFDDEIDSLKQEYIQLKEIFKKVEVAPLLASLSSTRLHIPSWYAQIKES